VSQEPDKQRESLPELPNRLGLDGIEFIEYATSKPQALGQVLEQMGFRPVARHRSREVMLYRQGTMNLVVNASPEDGRLSADAEPVISAVAFRVRDAQRAYKRCLDLGAWEVPGHAQAMELHIPAIHGPGSSRIYFVDRYKEFSIYDIDFVPIPTVETKPPTLSGMSFFGVVQYIGIDRSAEWIAFYQEMFDFSPVAAEERFGILPSGFLLRSPCGQFLWQLIEPHPDSSADAGQEQLQRIGLGTPDVKRCVQVLKERGVEFVESKQFPASDRGALTRAVLGNVAFELVQRVS
jgi:4-hydroxyphenylpyruvate dioxygenase